MPKCEYDDCDRRAVHYGLCYRHYAREWRRKNGKERRHAAERGDDTKTIKEMRWARRAYHNATSVSARIDWRKRITEIEREMNENKAAEELDSAQRYGICEMCGVRVPLGENEGIAIICGKECLRARLIALEDDRMYGVNDQ